MAPTGLREAIIDLILNLPKGKTLQWAFDGEVEDPQQYARWERQGGTAYSLGWVAGVAACLDMTRFELCQELGYTGEETSREARRVVAE